ncbi:unnamed protein product [Blepharisma stoltei]|uniref:Protein kinase domain-containing protein n=1 Tax=Blepharisma stoltei TaxID=1481888 RepID=A0AAU9IUI9_9CILI|nr:unnamed protein product [Blepharisma stoltei]
MEVLDDIIEFLRENHLDGVVKSINQELTNPKKPVSSDQLIVKAIEETAKAPMNSTDQNTLHKFLKKLSKKPVVSQIPSGLSDLKAFKKFLNPQPLPAPKSPARESKVEELPHFGGKIEANPIPANDPLPTNMNLDEDELFSASQIEPKQEPSSIMQHSNRSFGALSLEEEEIIDEYEDDDDPGFILYESKTDDINVFSSEIAAKHGFPEKAIAKSKAPDKDKLLLREDSILSESEKKGQSSLFPSNIKFPDSNDKYYPVEFESVIFDCYILKVIYDREKTGFEESKDFQIVINSVIAGRYQVIEFLGSAAFSKAIQCLDLITKEMVCLKIIENNKDYVDQSIDEIKLLKYINVNADPDEKHILRLIDYFYHKEHLFIVTELLRDNLYEYSKYNREHEEERYFTIGRLQKIAYQVLCALEYLHSLKLIHCDLKPENILIRSYSRCEVKVIDLGSSCYIHDHLGSYVQSRSYRAPEVIMGCPYDYKIDIWSLGCILAELYTGYVLFQNDSVQGLLARVLGIIGPLPEENYKTGRHTDKFFTKDRLLYIETEEEKKVDNKHLSEEMIELIKKHRKPKKVVNVLVPKKTSLKARLHTDDSMFIDFVRCLLDVDKDRRPSAQEAMKHPWITECKYEDGIP